MGGPRQYVGRGSYPPVAIAIKQSKKHPYFTSTNDNNLTTPVISSDLSGSPHPLALHGGQGRSGHDRNPPPPPPGGSQVSLTPRPPHNAWGSHQTSAPNSWDSAQDVSYRRGQEQYALATSAPSPAPSGDSYIPPTPPLDSNMPSYNDRGGFTPRPPQESSRRSSAPSSTLDYDESASKARGFGGDATWEVVSQHAMPLS